MVAGPMEAGLCRYPRCVLPIQCRYCTWAAWNAFGRVWGEQPHFVEGLAVHAPLAKANVPTSHSDGRRFAYGLEGSGLIYLRIHLPTWAYEHHFSLSEHDDEDSSGSPSAINLSWPAG